MKYLDSNLSFQTDYYPFPIIQVNNFLENNYLNEFIKNYPELSLFKPIEDPSFGFKYSLSKTANEKNWTKLIKQSKVWRNFFKYINSIEFQQEIISKLLERNIDLDIYLPKNYRQHLKYNINNFLYKIEKIVFKKKISLGAPKLKTSLEFQMMSAEGNYLLPHTDNKKKILTICLNLTNKNWKKEYGGGFSTFKPKDISKYYNYKDEFLQFSECETIKDYEFDLNTANLFIKTFNSLHGVKIMNGPKTSFRKSINFSFYYEK